MKHTLVEAIKAARNALARKSDSEDAVVEIDKFLEIVGSPKKIICQKCLREFHRFHDCVLNPFIDPDNPSNR